MIHLPELDVDAEEDMNDAEDEAVDQVSDRGPYSSLMLESVWFAIGIGTRCLSGR